MLYRFKYIIFDFFFQLFLKFIYTILPILHLFWCKKRFFVVFHTFIYFSMFHVKHYQFWKFVCFLTQICFFYDILNDLYTFCSYLLRFSTFFFFRQRFTWNIVFFMSFLIYYFLQSFFKNCVLLYCCFNYMFHVKHCKF